ncbi:MAG: hypothetical protein QM767_14080 [Anaeromyxobacter sp.]
MPRSDLALRAISLAAAVALVVVVHGEKRTTLTYQVPLAAGASAGRLPSVVNVTVSGPWARLRRLDAAALGTAEVALSPGARGTATWYVLAEKLSVPHGLRIDSIHPAQGTLELRATARPSGTPSQPEQGEQP